MYTKDEKEKLWEMEEIDRKARNIYIYDEGPEHKHNSLNEKKRKKRKGGGIEIFFFYFYGDKSEKAGKGKSPG